MSGTAAERRLARCRAVTGQYYSNLLTTHGPTPLGVDWRCTPTQELRFVQLLKLRGAKRRFSLNDLGCGYGALLAHLDRRLPNITIDYLGVDISGPMIQAACALWEGRPLTRFAQGHACQREADFSLASGVFNLRLNLPLEDWTAFVAESLNSLHSTSRKGFAVNFLDAALPGTLVRPELYRVRRETWTRYCQQSFGAQVEVISGYGMHEYTLLVRRPSRHA